MISDIFGASSFLVPSGWTAEKLASISSKPVFYYNFDHIGSTSMAEVANVPLWKLIIKVSFAQIKEIFIVESQFQAVGRFFNFNFFHDPKWATHMDELFYLFTQLLAPYNPIFTKEDEETSRKFVQLWTNFAHHFDPTPSQKGGLNGIRWKR